jgi:hypothetical protein
MNQEELFNKLVDEIQERIRHIYLYDDSDESCVGYVDYVDSIRLTNLKAVSIIHFSSGKQIVLTMES